MPELPDTNTLLQKSVTANDYADSPNGGAFFLNIAHHWSNRALPPELPKDSLDGIDRLLSVTPDHEAMWAAAVFIAKTKMSALAWEIEGDISLRVKRTQELLQASDLNRGWVSLLLKHLDDFLLTDNGGFIEVVRVKSNMNSQIVNLVPLDTLRCQRTNDPEIPVIYTDGKGRKHELRDYEVIDLVDEPSPRANLMGRGRCAAHRAYKTIYAKASVENYMSEKVSGRRPLAIHFVNKINDQQLTEMLRTAESEADAKGVVSYMGAIIATMLDPSAQPSVATVPLAEIPDGFDRKQEVDNALLTYADCIGLDPQDIQPLTGQPLGTGAQSAVLHDKAKGKGLVSWRQDFIHALNSWVVPDMTTFMFVEKDWRDKAQEADVKKSISDRVVDQVKNSVIDARQGVQVLVDEEVLPDEFLPQDQTPDTSLSDTDKPEDEQVEQPEASAPTEPQAPVPAEQAIPSDQAQVKELIARVKQRMLMQGED